jgi:uncharacterized protein (TIGR01777 family)
MKILLTGATGFLGQYVARELLVRGHQLVILSRDAERARASFPYPAEFYTWDPRKGPAPREAASGVQAVVNLAGESIAARRWTVEQKKKIVESRTLGTRHLWDGLLQAGVAERLKVFVSASAVGIYGDRGDEILTEASAPGEGFLSEVCRAWEKEIFRADVPNTRQVALRIGVVLGTEGGALQKLLPVFQSGLGGPVGGGKQWMSWIEVEDLARLFADAVEKREFEGPINAVAADPVTNGEFSKVLAFVVGKPALLPAPAMALKVALGEMSAVILSSQRVRPEKLLDLGFTYQFNTLEDALRHLCAPGGDPRDSQFVAEQWVPRTPEEVFPYFSAARNLEELTPPWLNFEIQKTSTDDVREGTLIDYRLKIHGVPAKWRTRIEEWEPNKKFVDLQLSGPYTKWHHTHSFIPMNGGTLLRDRVLYRLPLGSLGRSVAQAFVKKDVAKIFAFRRKKITELFK